MMADQLKFTGFQSTIDPSFWHAFTKQKLEHLKLDESPVSITGSYNYGSTTNVAARLRLENTSFGSELGSSLAGDIEARGTLRNTNTLDSFKTFDLAGAAQDVAVKLASDIISGAAIIDHGLLSPFLILSHSDLKKYKYYHWMATPALKPDADILLAQPVRSALETFTQEQLQSILETVTALRTENGTKSWFVMTDHDISQLRAISSSDDCTIQEATYVMLDPSSSPQHPGWPLRNFLALLSSHRTGNVRVLCLRRDQGRTVSSASLLLDIELQHYNLDPVHVAEHHVKAWEKNAKGKFGPRMVNLQASMDPQALAESAVDLNLKLIRWRLLPEIQLEKLAATKCLLLGAGTLGCNVARALLGWGVRHITFVDNGNVSYSNPVRQTLFQFEDCLNGGAPKAETAAMRLKQIFPAVVSRGIKLSIPMAGHPVDKHREQEVFEATDQLHALIEDHDAIFLLMDTREARWLPSVISATLGKLCFTAALGFDTYLAMRHGVPTAKDSSIMSCGCYFCNDVKAPADSTRDRSLDQQCTVSRPGLSFMASASAVELMTAVLHHPQGGRAPASEVDNLDANLLGCVPQQLRGSFTRFDVTVSGGEAYSQCTACSSKVRDMYLSNRDDLLRGALSEPQFLEDLTGLTAMFAMVDEMDFIDDWELTDDDIDDDSDGHRKDNPCDEQP
eukprot:TRINITY_DN9333_c0_g1_i5.p1 TRINITY_DN9333_c0_g1~~TRINITY_DN9333_c0_g1_i5.p1  ORF type:complete len:678 (+),score=139.56 TRINITY_DN9333_c0_g1_i5:2-2035(+)